MTNMSGVIQQLKKERVRLEDQLHRVTAALTAFGRVYMNGTGTKAVAGHRKGTTSAAARKKISLAQKARWAKQKAAGHGATEADHIGGGKEADRGGAESTVGEDEERRDVVE